MSIPEQPTPSSRARFVYLVRRIIKPVTRERRGEVQVQLRNSSNPGFDFFLLVVLSCVIATLGLLTDSPAVIIGAMLVAPLMSPILGLGLASLTGDAILFSSASVALVRGAVSAILISGLLTYVNRLLPFLPLQDLPAEVLARTHPGPIDLTIALAGGLAAAFALAMPSISAALPGVAIATALMPPLCVVGIGIALNRWDIAGGALLLFITNAVTIAFAAMLVFFALGFRVKREDGHFVPRALVIAAISTLVLMIPLTWASIQFFQYATENRILNEVVSHEVARFDADLANMTITDRDGTLHMNITVRTTQPLTYEDVTHLQEEVAIQLQRPVSVVINQVFAARLDPLIPPTFTITPTPVTMTPTMTSTFTATPTKTPTATPVPPTATTTPFPALVIVPRGRTLDLFQSPGGPSIGQFRKDDLVTVLYGSQVLNGIVWLEVMDQDGRVGWIPQIQLGGLTGTPTPGVLP